MKLTVFNHWSTLSFLASSRLFVYTLMTGFIVLVSQSSLQIFLVQISKGHAQRLGSPLLPDDWTGPQSRMRKKLIITGR